jgi:hypothetical protein
MVKNSIRRKLITILNSCELGKELVKEDLMKQVGYTPKDYYSRRSFDSALCDAKKFIPHLIFKSNSGGVIKRIQ